MPVISPDLGYGTTIAFATSTFSASIRSINLTGQTREVVDVSHLSTVTTKRKLIADLVDVGGFEGEFIWASTAAKVPPISGAVETITITLPDTSTIIGKGAVTNYTGPNIAIDECMMGTFTVTWNGTDSGGSSPGPVIAAAA